MLRSDSNLDAQLRASAITRGIGAAVLGLAVLLANLSPPSFSQEAEPAVTGQLEEPKEIEDNEVPGDAGASPVHPATPEPELPMDPELPDRGEIEAPVDDLEATDPPGAEPLPDPTAALGESDAESGSGETGADPALFGGGLSAEELALLDEVEDIVVEATGDEPETNPALPIPDAAADPDGDRAEIEPTPSDADDSRWQFGGHIGTEYLQFFSSPSDPRQPDYNFSLALNPELSYRWIHADSGRRHTFNFSPFYRLDQHDDKRTHFDVRELNLLSVGDGWDLRIGAGKVFWGATETVHWVDIINQTDLVEDIDGEEKLGQPMINLNLTKAELGTLGLFVLPYFRDRTFPGAEGRPRTIPRVLEDEALYESAAGQWHTDFALRWDKSLGGADIGLAYFYGTAREPNYVPTILPSTGETVLRPLYEIIHQGSLDVQYALDDWLLKLESVYRSGHGDENYFQVAGGFEYTFHRFLGGQADLGVISEMLYDSRGDNNLNPYENDIALGFRLGMNDLRDTQVLFAAITDLHDGSTTLSLEASLRLKDQWRLTLEGRGFAGIPPDDFPLNGMRLDQSLQLSLEYHF